MWEPRGFVSQAVNISQLIHFLIYLHKDSCGMSSPLCLYKNFLFQNIIIDCIGSNLSIFECYLCYQQDTLQAFMLPQFLVYVVYFEILKVICSPIITFLFEFDCKTNPFLLFWDYSYRRHSTACDGWLGCAISCECHNLISYIVFSNLCIIYVISALVLLQKKKIVTAYVEPELNGQDFPFLQSGSFCVTLSYC